MTPFEKQIWPAVFGARVVQRGWPITHDDLSQAIRLADSTIIAMRGRNRTHGNDTLEAERLAQQPCQPPESTVELATRLRERILSAPKGSDAWDEHTMDDIMRLLDMVIGTPEDGTP